MPQNNNFVHRVQERKKQTGLVSFNDQSWPESLFQTPPPLLFQTFWIRVRIRVRLFFKFENPTPVQTSAAIIDQTVIYPCFYLRNDSTDSCYCRNGKVTPDPGPVYHKFFTPDPGPKDKRRILPESTPVIQIRSHLCQRPVNAGSHKLCVKDSTV